MMIFRFSHSGSAQHRLFPALLTGAGSLCIIRMCNALLPLLLLPALLGGCLRPGLPRQNQSPSPPPKALSQFSLSLMAEAGGDYSNALKHIEQAIRLDPQEASLYAAASALALKLDQPENAVQLARKQVEFSPDPIQAGLILAQVALLAGQPDLAEKTYLRLLADAPGNPAIAVLTARFYLEQQQNRQAAEVLRKGLAANPDEGDLQHLLATLYLNEARSLDNADQARDVIEKSIKLLKKSVDNAPDDPLLRQQLALALQAAGKPGEALQSVRAARRLAPDDLLTARQLFNLLLSTGRTEEALREYNGLAADTGTDPDVWLLLLAQQLPPGDLPLLQTHLEERIETRPSTSDLVYTQLGILYLSTEQNQKAETVFRQALEHHPDAIQPHYNLMALQAADENYAQALEHALRFEQAITARSADELLTGAFYYQFAVLRERNGELEEAERLFRKAIDLGEDPTVAAARNYIAYMWAERGEKLEMAEDLVRLALEFDPENGAYLDTLGWIFYMQGRYNEALIYLEKALESGEEDPVIQEHIDAAREKLERTP
jgi:tetratricopeptide (TPR) repeat protein